MNHMMMDVRQVAASCTLADSRTIAFHALMRMCNDVMCNCCQTKSEEEQRSKAREEKIKVKSKKSPTTEMILLQKKKHFSSVYFKIVCNCHVWRDKYC
jgi:hypothetical protein